MAYQGSHSGLEVDDAVGVAKGTGTGFISKIGTGTGVKRTLTGSARVTISNGDGVSADPVFDFTQTVIDSLSNADTAFSWGDHSQSGYLLESAYTAADVKTKYESNTDTNVFTDSEKSKLSGIESGATADQTAAEIKTLYESNANTNAFTDSEQSLVSTSIQPGDPLAVPHVVVSASKTFALSDENTEQQVDAASTLTIATDATVNFSRGTKISVLSLTTGTVTITASTGVTLNGVDGGSTTISNQWSGGVITKLAANSWAITGDVGAVS